MKARLTYQYIISLLAVLSSVFCANAQKSGDSLQLQLLESIAGHYSNMTVDNLGNIYALADNNSQMKKMKPNGDSLGIFNDIKQYGNIYSIDVSNPLKILLYYKDYTTIVILDRFLNNVNKVDLRQSGILQAKAVSQSYDNLFWVFDMQEYKLKKINETGQVVFSSDDFRILFSNPINPVQIIDRDGSLYLYDPEIGWCIMDYYGAVKGQYPHQGWNNVGVRDGKLYGWKNNELMIFDPTNFNVSNYKLPLDFSQTKFHILVNNKIYSISKEAINVYNYQ